MGKTKSTAQQGQPSEIKKHAEPELSRRSLSDGEPEPTPPRNNQPVSSFRLEVTEELESFNTAHEKAPSEESDEHQGTSAPEIRTLRRIPSNVALPNVPIRDGGPGDKDESPLPLVLVDEEKNLSEAESESAKKMEEENKDEEVVSLWSESEDASVKKGRKKLVLKRLGLHSSKQQKTGEANTPTQSHILSAEDAAKSPFLAKEAVVSARVQSKNASEQSVEVIPCPLKKRYDQFLKRKVIAKRLVDKKEIDQWGYLAVIRKGSMESTVSSLGVYVEQVVAEFYAGLPNTRTEADNEEVAVTVQGHLYKFSSSVINGALDLDPLTEENEEAEMTLDEASATKLVSFLTDNTRKEWDSLTTADLTPCFGALMIIAAHNWIPSTHKTHVSLDRARLIYKMAHGVRVDMGKMIFKQIINLGVIHRNDSRWLIFPRLIMGLLQEKYPVPSHTGDKIDRPIAYKKDKRVGEIYEQRKAKVKVHVRADPKIISAKTTRLPSPAPPASTPSSRTGPSRVSVYELG
ncbi:uncharacterized protein LOC108845171 [Raphanus sativus]|uniref:Uncharacterized protein LOC108845171 n=1 Tax=Raphanus sativus TaxID=3726 RepID=A0A9W3DEM1_RAPSA|nr:uncharacterized protein LOC108845171 [Raphanus sativus]